MQDRSGQTIKSYTLEELIDAGGFGAVYRARQSIIDREVAIKVVLPEYANQPEFIRRFETEAQLIARLEHLHIVPLYDYWREPDGAFLVMRWLRGGNLHQALAGNRQWSLPATVRLMEQIGSALAVAHQNGIIHQDLKPPNILLDEQGNAFLADFGIAANLIDPESPARDRALLGTPLFMAPEQFTRDQPVTPQTDIYSLGIVLYTMLTGRVPFPAADVSTVIYKQIHEPVPPLQFVDPNLPHELNMVIRRATAKAPEARYADVLSMVADLRRLALGEGPVVAPVPSAMPTAPPPQVTEQVPQGSSTVFLETQALEPPNPYKGLRAFQEADAADFFGRDASIRRLLERLGSADDRARFLAVVGPSGSGKSSLVLAGLIPALRSGYITGAARWFVVKMIPSGDPFAELETALLRIASETPADLSRRLREEEDGLLRLVDEVLPGDETELLLVIDQFEEVFTLVDSDEERTRFLKSLHRAVTSPQSRLRVIVTLRADFYDRPLLYPGFGELVQSSTEVVLPLSPAELVQAIIRPAYRVGLTVEEDLLAAIVTDVSEQPGALPLLQYALTELFEHRQEGRLTLAAYLDSGGVLGALARRADELYEQLEPEGQQAASRLFLRLVTISEGGEATRRRVRMAEVLTAGREDGDTLRAVMERFGRHRLLTFDHDPQTREPTVEVAHEALIQQWGRLRQWLDDSREDLLAWRRLEASTTEWLNANREPSFLASGARLAQFEALVSSSALALDDDQRAYLSASFRLRQRTRNRGRLFVAALATFAVVALMLAIFAFHQRAQTDRQAHISRSRELAVTALTNLEQRDLALLLSLEALHTADTLEARNSLLTALQSPVVAFLHGHTDRVRAVAASPDGGLLASGGADNAIRLWDAGTHRPVGEPLTGHADWVNTLAFSPDGRTLASGSEDGSVRLWEVATGDLLVPPLNGHTGAVWRVAFSPDGQTLASAGADGAIILWAAATGQPFAPPLAAHDGTVYSVAFSPDGRWLASGGADNAARLWDAITGDPLGEHTQHTNWVRDVAFSPDGQLLLSTGDDTTIVLWDLPGGRLSQVRTGHNGVVRSLALSPDGSRLASASDDGTIQLRDMATGQIIPPVLTGHRDAVWSVAFAPDGTLVSGGADQAVIHWTVQRGGLFARVLTRHASAVSTIAVRPAPASAGAGLLLAFAGGNMSGSGGDTTVRLWELTATTNTLAGREVAALEGHIGLVTAVAFSPNGRTLASAGADQAVWLWPLAADGAPPNGDNVGRLLIGHTSVVRGVAFSPDGQILASCADDGSIILWDVATGEPSGEPLTHTSGLTAVTFSPDGRLLAGGSQDGHIILWDANTRQRVVPPLTGHSDEVTSLAFSPDGRALASGSRDNTIILWDVATGQPIRGPLTGHANWVLDVAFSPAGELLASSGRDGTIMLWDVVTGRAIGRPFAGHEAWANSLAFTPDGDRLLSGGGDMAIIAWEVNAAFWQTAACQVANRNLSPAEWERYFPDTPYRETCPGLS